MAVRCPKCNSDNTDTARFCNSCAAALSGPQEAVVSKTMTIQQSPKFISKGSILAGKYRIIEPIGKGGMGVVYKAEDIKLERTIALKFLPAELTEDSEARERFVREAKAAAALSHPHICTVYEIGEDKNQYFISMECIEGQSLKEKILKGPFGQAEALDIAIQVAEGLEEAHKKGIAHRDIKPGNIMVTEKGQAKVMDFGLAKIFGASLITKEAKTMGTVAYMSPEQAQGQSIDHRTDIWSAGVVLYEMLTGQLPFKGEYDQSIIHSILNKEPEPLTKALPKTPKALENVVFTALAKNPADRYQSMVELLEDLKAIAQGLKPLKAKLGFFRGRILGIRKPVFFTGIAALAVALAFIVFSVLIPSAQADVFDSVAILPIINETGDVEKEYFANGLTRELNTELYKVAALTVPPAETILTYKNSDKPPKKIAQELGVKAVVQVSWLQVGNRHRLIYTLSDPFRNTVIATDRLEMEEEDIIILQRELARAVVEAVRVAVTPAEQSLLAGGQKVNPEAYDLLMKGIAGYQGTDPLPLEQSIECVQEASEIDPDFALAHAWFGYLLAEAGFSSFEDDKVFYPKAWVAVQKAIKIDENLAMAFSTRGLLKFSMNWDFAGAEEDLKKALKLAPGDIWIPLFHSAFLCFSGRADEAIASLKIRMGKRTPAGQESLYFIRQSMHYLWAKRYDEALEESKKIPSTNPIQMWLIGRVTALKGSPIEALGIIDDIKDHPHFKGIPKFRQDRAWILALAGRREEALQALEEHITIQAQKNIDTTFDEACVYAGLGEKDRAFELLYESYENHSSHILMLIADWSLHSLHDDPRFEELRKKVGFPEVPTTGKH